MNKILTLAALIVALLISASIANAESRLDLARQYVELPGNQQMMDDMFSPEAMFTQIKANLPRNAKISHSKKRRMSRVLSQTLMQLRPNLEKIMITESARAFTKSELRAMIQFYTSKEGASILAKTPRFMERAMTKLAPQMQKVQEALKPALIKILKD